MNKTLSETEIYLQEYSNNAIRTDLEKARLLLNQLEQLVIESEAEYIMVKEALEWEKLLGTRIEVPPLPSGVTAEVRKNLERMGLHLRYIPALELGNISDLQSKGVVLFLSDLEKKYPKWHRFEGLPVSEHNDISVARNLTENYWEKVKEEVTDFPQLPGSWVAVETIPKPSGFNSYMVTRISEILSLKRRFRTSWAEVHTAIEHNKKDIIAETSISPEEVADVRMLEPLEWNLLGNREGWGNENTEEWTNAKINRDGLDCRILCGGSTKTGAGGINWSVYTGKSSSIGYRVALMLK